MSDGRDVFILRESVVKATFNAPCEQLGEEGYHEWKPGGGAVSKLECTKPSREGV